MNNYLPVYFENLEHIQSRVLDFFPNDKRHGQSLFYIKDNVKHFLSIPELKDNLDRLRVREYVNLIGFYYIPTTTVSGTFKHIDYGDNNYSLNVPISGCNNTWVNFYKSDIEPVLKYNNAGVRYYHCDQESCILTERFEMNHPYVINVKTIHNVVNTNPEPRITLLIRLGKGWHLDMLSAASHNSN